MVKINATGALKNSLRLCDKHGHCISNTLQLTSFGSLHSLLLGGHDRRRSTVHKISSQTRAVGSYTQLELVLEDSSDTLTGTLRYVPCAPGPFLQRSCPSPFLQCRRPSMAFEWLAMRSCKLWATHCILLPEGEYLAASIISSTICFSTGFGK